jgi:AcrR family transcriptional regulator
MAREERAATARDERYRKVLDAAIAQAKVTGYRHMTRNEIAQRAGVADGSVNFAFGTMDMLRDEVMRYAVAHGVEEIVAQGLADGHGLARNAPIELRQKAALALA